MLIAWTRGQVILTDIEVYIEPFLQLVRWLVRWFLGLLLLIMLYEPSIHASSYISVIIFLTSVLHWNASKTVHRIFRQLGCTGGPFFIQAMTFFIVSPVEHGINSHPSDMHLAGLNGFLQRLRGRTWRLHWELQFSLLVGLGLISSMNPSPSCGLWGSQLKNEEEIKWGLINAEPSRHLEMLGMSALSHRGLWVRQMTRSKLHLISL